MVLESLIGTQKAEHSPWDLFFIGLLFASVAVFLSLWIFKDHSSLVMVFLTVMACIPIIHKINTFINDNMTKENLQNKDKSQDK